MTTGAICHFSLFYTVSNFTKMIFYVLTFFIQLTVGFLMKGHTHSQIDQYFSRLSTYIGSAARGILTYQQFCTAVKECFHKKLAGNDIPAMVGLEGVEQDLDIDGPKQSTMLVDAIRLRKVYAFREWLIPFSKKIKNLHAYHHFWFFRDESGKAVMKYKQWATDAFSLKNLTILDSLPESSPLLIGPSKEKVDFPKLRQTVQKAVQVGALTNEERAEWSDFLAEEESYFEQYGQYERLKAEDRGKQHKSDVDYCIDPDDFDVVRQLAMRVNNRNEQAIPQALRQAQRDLEAEAKDICVESNSDKTAKKEKKKKPFKNSFLIINPDVDWCLSQSYCLLDLVEKPWLCRALTEPNSDGLITVQWFTGSIKSTWDVMKVKRQNRKGTVNYVTTIHKDSIILSHFRLKDRKIPTDAYEAIVSDLKSQCELYKSRMNISHP